MTVPVPQRIAVNRDKDQLSLTYDGTQCFDLSAEYLRVLSPSAEVRGHGPDDETLQVGKRWVRIQDLQKAGNYALKIHFDDGHDSGIYTWDYLYDLGQNHARYWDDYLTKLQHQGGSRDGDTQVINIPG